MRPALLLLAAPMLVLLAACKEDINREPTPTPPPRIGFNDGSAGLIVEIADDPGERSTGLMNRESLGENDGMLFVFPEDTDATFWMKDTLIPLSIAFVRWDGIIINIQDMEAQSEDSHASPEPFRYAIEANQGWFEANDVFAGERAALPDTVLGAGLSPSPSG